MTEHLKAADQHEQHDDREQPAEMEKQADALREEASEKAEQRTPRATGRERHR